MKSFLMVLFMQINVLVFAAEVGAGEVLLKCHDQKWPPQEIQSLMAKASSVIDEISQCKDDHNLKGEYLRKLDPPNKGWPQSLEDNPMLCLEALFDGLKGGAEDLMETIWDLAGAFSKVIDANFQGTYDFLKAAFTGNLSYWFAEASQNASDFLNKFLTSIKAIPDAVADSLKEKSEDWECRNDRGQVEMACRISGYLGADALAAVMTMGWNKLALVKKVSKLTKKILPNEKKKEKGFQKKEEKKDWSKAGLLGELIPLEKRSSRFVVEVDTKGHYSVRFFDESGAPKVFDGSPFYHLINKRHREAGEGTHRLKDRKTTNAGEHFTVDVAPEKFRQFLDYIEQKKGTISIACTRTACESMKAAGVDIGQGSVPNIDTLYKGLLDESAKESGAIKRVENGMSIADQDKLIHQFSKGTNLVKMQFGATAISGYLYAPASIGTPMNFIIDRMDSNAVDSNNQ